MEKLESKSPEEKEEEKILDIIAHLMIAYNISCQLTSISVNAREKNGISTGIHLLRSNIMEKLDCKEVEES